VTVFHVRLADRTHGRPTIDLTPERDLSYRDARIVMLEFGHLFPTLHEAGCPSYLEIWPIPGSKP
jgi:hypothetical protein